LNVEGKAYKQVGGVIQKLSLVWKELPRTKKASEDRVVIRIPKPMMDEVDRMVCHHKEYHYNRQQFVESAIREKMERIKLLLEKTGKPKAPNDV